MAIRSRVEELMRQELTQRAADRMLNAGNRWKDRPMGFFFPRNEQTTDLCALKVLDRALEEDGTRAPTGVRSRVRELVNTPKTAADAISTIFLATAQPMRVR